MELHVSRRVGVPVLGAVIGSVVGLTGLPSLALASPPRVPARKAPAQPASRQPMDCWYGFFVSSQHIGYLHLKSEEVVLSSQKQWDNRVEFFMNPTPGDNANANRVLLRVLTRQDGTLLETWEAITVNAKTTTTHQINKSETVLIEKSETGKPTTRQLLSRKAFEAKAKSGKDTRPNFFIPEELIAGGTKQKLPAGWKLGENEIITVDWRPVSATRLIMAPKDGDPGVFWVDQDRKLVRADLRVNGGELRLERMSAKTAVQLMAAAPNQDTITPDKPLDTAGNPLTRSYVLSRLAEPLSATTDDVQSLTTLKQPDGRYTAVVQVTAAPADEKNSVTIGTIDRTKFAAYLAAGTLTPVNDPAMRDLARQIVGTETNAARAARRLSEWVHTNLSYDWGFSGVRSAQQTLKDRRGVCQNYATLFVTLARAAGIPSKYCSGPAYSSDGKFYCHAWAECWTSKWVAFEPTWGQPFADASHIKLAEGEPDVPMSAWNNNAPPAISALAPNVDLAQVIRSHTPVERPMPSDEADTALAKQIQQSAVPLPQESVIVLPRAVYAVTVLARLPWGSTTQLAQSATVLESGTNKGITGVRYTLPDGRSCLVVVVNRPTPLDPETELAFAFEYKQQDGTWSRAFVPNLKFDGDKATLAKVMATQPLVLNRVLYADPPAPDVLLPLLPPGTTVTQIEDPNDRDGKGNPLKATSYQLPGGKVCLVIKASDF